MDRARFDNELAELLADPAAPDREARIAALAACCDEHPGGRELVALLARSPERRDPQPDPGPEYWATFDARVTERVRAAERVHGRRSALAIASVAAAIGLAVGLWMFAPGTGPADDAVVAGREVREPVVAVPGPALPDALIRALDAAEPADPVAVDLVAGLDEDWLDPVAGLDAPADDGAPELELDEGWMFPETYGLDAAGRGALLEWIREQEARLRGGRV